MGSAAIRASMAPTHLKAVMRLQRHPAGGELCDPGVNDKISCIYIDIFGCIIALGLIFVDMYCYDYFNFQ